MDSAPWVRGENFKSFGMSLRETNTEKVVRLEFFLPRIEGGTTK